MHTSAGGRRRPSFCSDGPSSAESSTRVVPVCTPLRHQNGGGGPSKRRRASDEPLHRIWRQAKHQQAKHRLEQSGWPEAQIVRGAAGPGPPGSSSLSAGCKASPSLRAHATTCELGRATVRRAVANDASAAYAVGRCHPRMVQWYTAVSAIGYSSLPGRESRVCIVRYAPP